MSSPVSFAAKVRLLCRMIKIEHSLFALPFAFMGSFAAAGGLPAAKELTLVAIAMVCIRSFAMMFNRIADRRYDALNPRTAGRALVTGEATTRQAWIFCAVMAAGFMLSAVPMPRICLVLSPAVLLVAAFYSYTKRFTWLCHFALGLMLAMAPMGGWLAVTGSFSLPPILLSASVIFWTAGFDIFYSCQDAEFDNTHGLHSAPVHFGIPASLVMAGFCHANMVIFLFLAGYGFGYGWPWYVTTSGVAAILIWEHRLVKPDDLTRVNLAFFILNALVAAFLFCGLLASIYFGA